jgi:hypothetical protein
MHDYKLGLRMLAKYPGLTIAGGLALSVAIAVGAGWYEVSRMLMRPALPLRDGDQIVEIAPLEGPSTLPCGWRRCVRSTSGRGVTSFS